MKQWVEQVTFPPLLRVHHSTVWTTSIPSELESWSGGQAWRRESDPSQMMVLVSIWLFGKILFYMLTPRVCAHIPGTGSERPTGVSCHDGALLSNTAPDILLQHQVKCCHFPILPVLVFVTQVKGPKSEIPGVLLDSTHPNKNTYISIIYMKNRKPYYPCFKTVCTSWITKYTI